MTTLPDPLPVTPFTRPTRGELTLPGSKSITNRALILAALGRGTVTLRGALFSRDTRIMVAALRTLGFDIGLTPDGPRFVELNMWWDLPYNLDSRALVRRLWDEAAARPAAAPAAEAHAAPRAEPAIPV